MAVVATMFWSITSWGDTTTPVAGKVKTVVKGLAAGLEALNNWGADKKALDGIRQLGPRIEHDLNFVADGGILLIAKMEI